MFRKSLLAAAALLLGLVNVEGFLLQPSSTVRPNTRLYDSKINKQIDLSNPKVVDTLEIQPGEKKVFCRCWQSKKWPLCDGSHVKHNEATGDNVGPLIVTVPKP